MYEKIPIKIQIVVYSFEFKKLFKSLLGIQSIIKTHGFSKFKHCILPLHLKKYTLNRSSHIDKKSREQFKMSRYRYTLTLESSNIENINELIYTLKHNLIQKTSGIGLKIELKYKTLSI